MKTLQTWRKAYNYQQKALAENTYDNGIYGYYNIDSGVENIDALQFALKGIEIVWLIMEDGYYIDDYEEGATQIGITKDGRWAVLDDGHCSCYGWEAHPNDVTYYDSLDVLLKADSGAKILLKHEVELKRHFPFLNLMLLQ
jgi:hypothetical protein